jgi:hypothetical protein
MNIRSALGRTALSKKCLITYSSITGHTEKVASRIQRTFESRGWQVDNFKIRKNADDILRPSYDVKDYDFWCVGSGVRVHLPYNEIINLLRRFRVGRDPRTLLRIRDESIPYITEPLPPLPSLERKTGHHHKITLGPDSPKGVVFITYAGYEFGPHEADPAFSILELEMEHCGFQIIGHFCCPGKFMDDPTPLTFHGDIRNRPDERDLLKAQMFIEDKLDEIEERQ